MAASATRMGGGALIAMAALFLCNAPTQAGYVVTLEQEAGGVVATGSGAIDLTGLAFAFSGTAKADMTPSEAGLTTGPAADTPTDAYDGFSGPPSFGAGGLTIDASSGSGDLVTIVGGGNLIGVPQGYLSGAALFGTSTYSGQTFASLGATPGAYEWTWGNGANQNFTLIIGDVPEPSTWAMMLIALAGLGYAGYRRSGRLSLERSNSAS